MLKLIIEAGIDINANYEDSNYGALNNLLAHPRCTSEMIDLFLTNNAKVAPKFKNPTFGTQFYTSNPLHLYLCSCSRLNDKQIDAKIVRSLVESMGVEHLAEEETSESHD